MSAATDRGVVKITIKRFGDHWKLTILGKRPEAKEPTVFYRARCADLADAQEQLKNWQNGVVIV